MPEEQCVWCSVGIVVVCGGILELAFDLIKYLFTKITLIWQCERLQYFASDDSVQSIKAKRLRHHFRREVFTRKLNNVD